MLGQQFVNPFASAAKWIFVGFFVVVLMGFLLGVNLKDATWLNSSIAAAEASRINIENAHQQATYELQEQLAIAQTEADIQQIHREQQFLDAQYQHDIQALNQNLAHHDLAFKTWMTLLIILVGTFAFILFVFTTIWAASKAWVYIQSNSRKEEAMAKIVPSVEKRIPNLPERETYDPWNDPTYRHQQRVAAQDQERKERQKLQTLAARVTYISDPAKMSSEKRNKLPQTDD
jgi:hypothetical protein